MHQSNQDTFLHFERPTTVSYQNNKSNKFVIFEQFAQRSVFGFEIWLCLFFSEVCLKFENVATLI